MTAKRTRTARPPKINPREPLTAKARAAIEAYVLYQGDKKGRFHFVMIDACLKAERMRREKLYQWLEEHGYRWHSRIGAWLK